MSFNNSKGIRGLLLFGNTCNGTFNVSSFWRVSIRGNEVGLGCDWWLWLEDLSLLFLVVLIFT